MNSQVIKEIENLIQKSYSLKGDFGLRNRPSLKDNFTYNNGLFWYKSNIVNVKPLKERLKENKTENIISEWDLKL